MSEYISSALFWVLHRWWIFVPATIVGVVWTRIVVDDARSEGIGEVVFSTLFGARTGRGLVGRALSALEHGANAHRVVKANAITKVIRLWSLVLILALTLAFAIG